MNKRVEKNKELCFIRTNIDLLEINIKIKK